MSIESISAATSHLTLGPPKETPQQKLALTIWQRFCSGEWSSGAIPEGVEVIPFGRELVVITGHIQNGSLKRVDEGIWFQKSISGETLQKTVAVWRTLSDSCHAVHEIRADIRAMGRYSFPTIAPPPYRSFYAHPTTPSSIVAIHKRYPSDMMTYLLTLNNRVGTISKSEFGHIINMLTQAMFGVAYLHKNGDMHLDLKPDNFLVDPATGELQIADLASSQSIKEAQELYNTKIHAKVSDITALNEDKIISDLQRRGVKTYPTAAEYLELCESSIYEQSAETLATLKHIDKLRAKNEFEVGSLRYMAPEVVQYGYRSPKADIYSLGCILGLIYTEIRGFKDHLSSRHTSYNNPFVDLVNGMVTFRFKKRIDMRDALKQMQSLVRGLNKVHPDLNMAKTFADLKETLFPTKRAEIAG